MSVFAFPFQFPCKFFVPPGRWVRMLAFWMLVTCSITGCVGAARAQSKPADVPTVAQKATNRATKPAPLVPITTFLAMLEPNPRLSEASFAKVAADWRDGYAPMLLEMLGLMASAYTESLVVEHLQAISGIASRDINQLYAWVWAQNIAPHPDYAEFKARLYEPIDPRFRDYFGNRPQTNIRLDEIRWGGVRRDGIPPLKNPAMLAAHEATYLADTDIVFGVALPRPAANGKRIGNRKLDATANEKLDIRAYPKRILAWHEMFKDQIAGREVNGVYCTLCGAMILYDTTVSGKQHELGTSGFLYRSNKLMYDHATRSLWSTFDGKPVVGALVGKGIVLQTLYVVTSTWGEWKKRHPTTTVLSPQTGHERDYTEGAAYRDYFATDRLMFGVPKLDDRLSNKAEVLALRGIRPGDEVAISVEFLMRHPVHPVQLGPRQLVVLTDASGANRVFESGSVRFVSYNQLSTAQDAQGRTWTLAEDRLIGPGGQVLKRASAYRAFWFGWYSAYPNTRLVR